MHPTLFEFSVPEWLQGILPSTIVFNTYGTLIATGALLGFIYLARRLKSKHNIPVDSTQTLFMLLLLAGFVGGKIFFYFEDFSYYLSSPNRMFKNMGSGFVFYGSLIFCIPIVVGFAKKFGIPLLQMLDHISITACIAHGFGRMGCLGAGCCHGLPTEQIWGITYTNPSCMAQPLNTPLHPTPIYSVLLIFGIAMILLMLERRQRFKGQLFLVYIVLYSIGRSIIEEFRGDSERGFVFDGFLSHSQLISILMVIGVGSLYVYLYKKRQNPS